MPKIGILAYGSLIEDPGSEIEPLIIEKVRNIETPFSIEFARSSKTRDGAPTLVPIIDGGMPVKAQLLVLNEKVDLKKAEDLLWRRETRNENTDKHYTLPINLSPNRMVVERLSNWNGIDHVIYTKLGSNIEEITAMKLADMAISSARGQAGQKCKDGINYLISIKRQGIVTKLSAEYEEAILKKINAKSLEEALVKVRNTAAI